MIESAAMVTVADTAFSIAMIRADEGALPDAERLFEDPYAHLFRAKEADSAEAAARFISYPFIREGVRLRTRFIDDAVRDAIKGGLSQVVLLGAGFDCRGLRIGEIGAVNGSVFEIDFPDQLDRKRAFLEAGGVTLPSWCHYVPCDLSRPEYEEPLLSALVAKGFVQGKGAVVVWEGVIDYIDTPSSDRGFSFIARAGGDRTRVVFTFGAMRFDPETAAIRTKRLGFSRCEEVGLDELWRRYELAGEPHPAAALARIGIATV